ncbi:Calcium-binding EF-hand [Corchorus olitorius]|uniref:Calcium-binding EF-hand n=1 Tax=Corchorus olitorius TaxID=93759 RepID=A0A1R3KEQ9_9ROSI|nr:Calcium-binding EF-hand [Corchorus olitorius]
MDKTRFRCKNVDKGCQRIAYDIKLKQIFSRYDVNKDGRLSKEELKNAFSELGSHVPMFRAFLALHHADKNGDRFIDIDQEEEMRALVQYAAQLGYDIEGGKL